jgi:hypothetical protein
MMLASTSTKEAALIRFGAMSISLLAGVLYGALVALLLVGAPHNRTANRMLAALIGVLAPLRAGRAAVLLLLRVVRAARGL